MTVVVTDGEGGEQVPARCSVIDSLGQSRYPDMYKSLYHTCEDAYFYSSGQFALLVPEGPTIVRVARLRDITGVVGGRAEKMIAWETSRC